MRRFQFSLRTLLIAVTLLAIPCGYVGWQAKIVRDRKAMMANIHELGWQDFPYEPWVELKRYPPPSLSWIREQLGDEWVVWIYAPKATPESEVQVVKSFFPEAEISELPDH